MLRWRTPLAALALLAAFLLGRATAPPPALAEGPKGADDTPVKGWKKGKGWGWVWGKDDEVGSLNAMTPATIKAALSLVKEGKVYDLGVPYDRNSFKWPGHSPGEVLLFRGPEGLRRQGDFPAVRDKKLNPDRLAWHSCALFI